MKKVRRLLTLLTAIALCVSVAVCNLGLTAFAAEVQAPAATIDGVVTPNTVTVGSKAGDYTMKGIDQVRDPFGNVTAFSTNYVFERAGYYTLVADGVDVFKVESVTDGAELVIGNAAAIPSYVATNSEVDLTAVSAKVMLDDETESTDYAVTTTYFGPGVNTAGGWPTVANGKFTPASAGTYTVRFQAKHNSVANLVLVEDFTVLVQDDFSDEEKPSLSVSGVPSTANTGVKLTLPKATATDASDKNVAITVSVKTPSGAPVYGVKDEDAKPVEKDEAVTVAFDNDGNMSFFPLEDGKYIVTYEALDDNGNKATYTAGITVSDKKAPDLEIEDEDLFPTTWGLTVTNAAGSVVDGIYIPAATVVDNAALPAGTAVTVTIKDPNGTIFFDSSSADKSGANVPSVTFVNGTDASEGYYFNPGAYETNKSQLGTYTVTYKAKDAKSMQRTITKTVVVDATAEDTVAPVITFAKNNAKVLYVGDAFPTLTQTIDEDNGYKVVKTFTNGTLNNATDVEDAVLAAGNLVYTVTATDVFGNVTMESLTIPVVSKTEGQAVSVSTVANVSGATGVELDFGTATLSVASATDYLGFEAFILNPNGQYVANKVTYVPCYNSTELVIRSIKFTPTMAGEYKLVLRGFEQGGVSNLVVATATVTGNNTDAPIIKPLATTSASVDAGSAYTLPSYEVDGTEVVAITGSRYSVMGKSFVPMVAGDTYVFEAFAEKNGALSDPYRTNVTATSTTGITFKLISDYDLYAEKFDSAAYAAAYKAASTDDAKKAVDKQYMVKVPQVEVVSKYGDVELSVKVTPPTSQSSANVKVFEYDGEFFFRNDFDGTYTVTYTAKSATTTQTYELTLKSGDITLPTITVTTEPAKNMVQYDTIKFSAVTVSDDKTEASKVTVTKSLLFNGSVVESETGTAAGTTAYTLDKVGTYTVRYEATDEAGNTIVKNFTVTVTAEASSEVNTKVISTVLIIVAALLVVGLLIYFFVFKKTDLDKKKK
jgi:hypothetical protein